MSMCAKKITVNYLKKLFLFHQSLTFDRYIERLSMSVCAKMAIVNFLENLFLFDISLTTS